MMRLTSMLLAAGLVGAALALPPAEPVLAQSAPKSPSKRLSIVDPWVREAPPGIRILGAYMTVVNPDDQADRLLSASSPLAEEIEIHRMSVANGMMTMEAIPFLTVPARGEVKLQPGGNHLMIYGMKRELKEGDRLPLDLKFERAGTLSISAPVRKVMGKH